METTDYIGMLQDLSTKRSEGTNSSLKDDIECKTWLDEVELPQYQETFITNFSTIGNLLSRRRLKTVRLQDFPNMNITDYDHARILLEHIRITLKYSFDSSDRLREVKSAQRTRSIMLPSIAIGNYNQSVKLTTHLADVHVNLYNMKRKANHQRYISQRRREAFDNKVWNTINKFRDDVKPLMIQNIRDGIVDKPATGPLSMSSKSATSKKFEFDAPLSPKRVLNKVSSKAKDYGDAALDYDMLLNKLKSLQAENLTIYCNLINCETANIFFINNKTRELMLYVNDKWFKMSMDQGIAGYVARTGESLCIPDAYADERFNRYLLPFIHI